MMNVYVPFSPLQPKFSAGEFVACLILAAAFCFTAAAQTSVSFGDNGLNFPTPACSSRPKLPCIPPSILAMEP